MKFVKTEDLKIGMRLAKPIYNNKGVLLYERDSELTTQGIDSIKNFGLIGIYILEPAEPLPPMSQDDIDFERFQTVSIFTIKDELNEILNHHKQKQSYQFAETVLKAYGRLERKINFVQNLRSSADFVYKHSLNVAMLCALISRKMNIRHEEQLETIIAGFVHDIGKLQAPEELIGTRELDEIAKRELSHFEFGGISIVEQAFYSSPNIKRIILQSYKQLEAFRNEKELENMKLVNGARVLIVAETYDAMTAMCINGEPQSEIKTLKFLQSHPEIFDPEAVEALVKSIHFVSEGCSVELSNGQKALVLSANEKDVLRPILLCFSNNMIMDLQQTMMFGDIEIVDIMKTMDNRYAMDLDAVKKVKEE